MENKNKKETIKKKGIMLRETDISCLSRGDIVFETKIPHFLTQFMMGVVIEKGKTFLHDHPYIKIKWTHYYWITGFEENIKKYYLHNKETFYVLREEE